MKSRRFEERFRKALKWKDLFWAVEIKLCFQISLTKCGRSVIRKKVVDVHDSLICLFFNIYLRQI